MTVSQLIKLLADCHPNAPVFIRSADFHEGDDTDLPCDFFAPTNGAYSVLAASNACCRVEANVELELNSCINP